MARLSKQMFRWPLMLHQYKQGRMEPLVCVSVSFIQIISPWHAPRHVLGRYTCVFQWALNTCIFAYCWWIWKVEWGISGSRLCFLNLSGLKLWKANKPFLSGLDHLGTQTFDSWLRAKLQHHWNPSDSVYSSGNLSGPFCLARIRTDWLRPLL